MKKLVVLVLCLIWVSCGIQAAFAENREIEVVNYSGVDIYELTINPSGADGWSSEVLGGRALKDGQKLRVVVSDFDSGVRTWDVLARDCCGDVLRWGQLNLNQVNGITLNSGGIAEVR